LAEVLLKIDRALGFATFSLVPFLGGNHLTLFHFTVDRFWIETSFILLMLASIVMACYQKRWPTNGFRKFLVFFCPLLAMATLSLTYTWSLFNTLNEINILIWALGASFLFLATSHRDDLMEGLVAGAALSALCAVWQFLVLFPSLAEVFKGGGYAAMLKDQHVPFSSFLNQNMLGGYCASVLPLALHSAFLKRKTVYVVAVCLISVGLILSLSRLAVLSSIPSCAIVAVLVFRERGIKGVVQMASCIGGAALIVLVMIYGPYHKRDTNSIQNTLEGKIQRSYKEATTLNFRTDIWKTGLKAFSESPVVGYGAGSFVYPYQKFYEGKRYTKVAHGTLIKLVVELGSLGLLCFFWFCFGLSSELKNCLQDRGILMAGLSALVVFLFGLFDFSFDTAAHVVTFFCLSSACFCTGSAQTSSVPVKIASALLVLLFVTSFVYTAKADSSRKFVEDARAERETGFIEDALRSSVDAVEAMPWNNDASTLLTGLLTSSFLNEKDPSRKERLRSQLRRCVQAVENNRDKDAEMYFVAGTARNALGDGIGSCHAMDRALQYHPSSAGYAFFAAACFARNGQIERAQSIARSMGAYYQNYHTWGYPDGAMVHKIKDLEAEIEVAKGNREQALSMMRQNLDNAKNNQFVINDWRARQSVTKDALIDHLERQIRLVEAKTGQDERSTARASAH
jgi:O-antigen ligase